MDKVQCSHLLVKHIESRRPASWRSDNITRSKEEALQILEGTICTASVCLMTKSAAHLSGNFNTQQEWFC